MKETFDPFTGGGGGGATGFAGVLFTCWEDDYDQVLTDVVDARPPKSCAPGGRRAIPRSSRKPATAADRSCERRRAHSPV
jgi:hypothetical protein